MLDRGRSPAKYLCVVTYDTDMTAVRLRESTRYGLRLYGYVLGVVILGGGTLALGIALLYPEIRAWRGSGQVETVPAVAGGVLGFIGLSILVVGALATVYKLLADGVAAGRPAVVEDVEDEKTASEPTPATEPATPDPNVGAAPDGAGGGDEPAQSPAGSANAAEPTAVGSMADGAESTPAESEAAPPEPSPEEIAFGSSGDDPAAEESTTEPETSTTSGTLPGQNATSDPLADPGDE